MPPPPFQGSLAACPSAACPPVMPPNEDALDADAGDVLTFRLHPLAVLKLSNRIREYRLRDHQYQAAARGRYSSSSSSSSGTAAPEDAPPPPPRMYGCVIGVRRGGTVDVSDTFDILHDPDPGTFDLALLKKDQEIYKKAFPDLAVLGWYSIGTNVHATDMGIHHGDYTDMQIHQALMDANGTAFYLLSNPAINFSQKYLPVTIYERVLCNSNGSSPVIFVQGNYTVEIVEVERISVDHAGLLYPSPCVVFDVLAPPLGKEKNAFRTMLFETPSGFAMFRVSDLLFRYPEDIWLSCTDPRTAHQAICTIGFIEVGDKSVVWDKDIGPGEDLEQFILKFPIAKSLVVPDAQLKFVIEKKLNIGCWFNGRIVPELIWGLNYALDEFVPQEKGNLSDERHLPLSKQLHEQLKAYGFSISPHLAVSVPWRSVDLLKANSTNNIILEMMKHKGFDDKWRSLVQNIISTTTTSVLLNGVPGKSFTCKRGVRQGDSLSPLLFVLAADLLQSIINQAYRQNLISLPIPHNSEFFPIIQYADDTLIIMKENQREIFTLKSFTNLV